MFLDSRFHFISLYICSYTTTHCLNYHSFIIVLEFWYLFIFGLSSVPPALCSFRAQDIHRGGEQPYLSSLKPPILLTQSCVTPKISAGHPVPLVATLYAGLLRDLCFCLKSTTHKCLQGCSGPELSSINVSPCWNLIHFSLCNC